MLMIEIVWFFGLGLIVGSFLNVLVLRHGTGKGLGGRSGCLSCGKDLAWHELFPILSWLLQRGRCRRCGSRISPQYPLVELASGLAFLLIGLAQLPLQYLILCLGVVALLVAIATYDILHTIIPDDWVAALFVLGILYAGLLAYEGVQPASIAIMGSLTMMLPLWGLWAWSRGHWMGFGDVKLAAALGLMLAPAGALTALFLAFITGAIIGVCILLPLERVRNAVHTLLGMRSYRGSHGYTMRSEVPFGPFLILGFFIVWLSSLYDIQLPFLLVGMSII